MSARSRWLPIASGLPFSAWVLQGGVALNFFGNGLVGPFLVIYLHFVRGIPLAAAGLAVGSGAVLATTSGLVVGPLIDRFGPRRCLSLAMVSNALAYTAYTQVHSTWQAFWVGAAVGIGTGAYGPCVQSLLSTLVPAVRRATALSQQRMSAIVGLGLGATVGGAIAAGGRPEDYQLLLLLDAGTFAGFAVLVLGLPSFQGSRDRAGGGYREAFRDGRLWALAGLNLVLVSAAIAPMLWLLPAFARGQARVPALAIGLLFALNTGVILVAQLPITRAVSGRGPLQVLALGSSAWVLAWGLVLGSGWVLSGWPAAGLIAVAMVFYAAGECVYTAIVTPTTVAIAPEALRGRYLGVLGFAWQAGFLVGPASGSLLLGRQPLALPAAAAAACLLVTGMLLGFGRRFRSAMKAGSEEAVN